MEKLTEWLNQILPSLESNPLLPVIASGGLTVWLIANLKSIFFTIKDFVTSLISFTIYNSYDDERARGFDMRERQVIFDQILSKSKILWERSKELDLMDDTSDNEYCSTETSDKTYGFSIRWIYGSLVLCTRSKAAQGQKMIISTHLRVFFSRKRKFMEKLIRDINVKKNEVFDNRKIRDYVNVLTGRMMMPGSFARKNKRSLDSIFMNNDEHISLYKSITDFIDNKPVYAAMNMPYKFSALLYGKPGTGKSSTILAIASALNRDIIYINAAAESTSTLLDKLNGNTDKSIYVFEDVDAIGSNTFTARKPAAPKTDDFAEDLDDDNDSNDIFASKLVSLSDILNITDGLLSSDGAICLFTTNHIEKLDPAFLRAGRMNKLIEFDYLNSKTAKRMAVKRFSNFENMEFKNDVKPAELQADLLEMTLSKKIEPDKEFIKKYSK